MKKLLVFALVLISSSLMAQDWKTNLEDAKAQAAKSGKNILLVFAGSDWCAPCIKLDKTVWQSEEFKADAKDQWVLLKADFPKKKQNKLPEAQEKHNAMLAEKYNREGNFPLVVIIDKNGNVLAKTGYKNVSPKEYIAMLHKLEK